MKRSEDQLLETSEEREAMFAQVKEVPELEHKDVETPILAITKLLWRHGVQLRKGIVVGLLVGLVLAFLIPGKYEASVQLMPPDSNALSGGMGMLDSLMAAAGSSTSGGGVSSGIAGGLGELLGGAKPGPLFVGILGCRTIADRIINRFDLRRVYWRKTYDSARKKLKSNTNIAEDKKTGIIQITVEDGDRARAVALAQAYVSELDRLLAQVNNSSASRERSFLEQRLAVVHQDLDNDSRNLSQYSSKNATFNPEDQGKAMLEATAILQGQLIAAQSELSGLEQIYTGENVRVRSLRAHVAELNAQLNKLGGKNYEGANSLDTDSLYPSLRQLPVLAVQYSELFRRVKIDVTVLELLTKEYELAKVEEAKQTPSVKVLDAPQLPEKRSWPPRFLIVLLGGFFGLVCVSGWIIGAELWAEIDPNEPHKEFWTRELRPWLTRNTARVRPSWQRLSSRSSSRVSSTLQPADSSNRPR